MYGKTNVMVYEEKPYIGGSINGNSFISKEQIEKVADNKELFGMFIMLTVSAISMVYGFLM